MKGEEFPVFCAVGSLVVAVGIAVVGVLQVPSVPVAPIIAPTVIPASKTLLVASWYGPRHAGRLTANGEMFDPQGMTYASRTDPFNTWRRLSIGPRVVFVRCNDRGPYHKDRDIDLSLGAAQHLGMVKAGVAIVEAEVVK